MIGRPHGELGIAFLSKSMWHYAESVRHVRGVVFDYGTRFVW